MKISKVIAAAMSMAIMGGTMPYVGFYSPETIITANAAAKNVFPELETMDIENAVIYNGDKTASFDIGNKRFYSGVILSKSEDQGSSFIEFDVSDTDTFSFVIEQLSDTSEPKRKSNVCYYLDNDCSLFVSNKYNAKDIDVSEVSRLKIEITGGTYEYALYDIITDNGRTEPHELIGGKNILPGLKTSDYENAEFYDGDKSEPLSVNGRKYYNGAILSKKDNERSYVEFDVSELKKFSLKYKSLPNVTSDLQLNVILDNDTDNALPVFMKYDKDGIDVSKHSKIRFEIEGTSGDYIIYDICTDKEESIAPDIPEYKSNADLLANCFDIKNAEVFTGLDKDKSFNVLGRTYYQGIILSSKAGAKSKLALNVDNIDKLRFSYGSASGGNGAKDCIEVGSDSDDIKLTIIGYDGEEKYEALRMITNNGDFIRDCELDVSTAETVVFYYDNERDDSYAIMNIQADDMPLETGYVLPEYKDDTDILKNAFVSPGTEVYIGEDEDKGIILGSDGLKYYWLNGKIRINVENIDRISFTLSDLGGDSDKLINNYVDTLYMYTNKKDGMLYEGTEIVKRTAFFDFDVSDASLLTIGYRSSGDYDRKIVLTDISYTSTPDAVEKDCLNYIIHDKYAEVAINKNCSSIPENITIPEEINGVKVTTVGDFGSSAIKSVIIPDSVTVIKPAAFSGASNLESIKLGKGLNAISGRTFENCSSLVSVTIPDSVETIGKCAFYGCSLLKDVTFGKNVSKIESEAFAECSSLKSVVLPDKVTALYNGVFYNCTGLESVSMGDNIKILSGFATEDEQYLLGVSPYNYYNVLYGTFEGCSNLKTVKFSEKLHTINTYAFKDCTSLTYVKFPDSLRRIESNVFENADGLTVEIPAGVKSIYTPFSKCKNVVVRGYEGTEAEDYASSHSYENVTFESLGAIPVTTTASTTTTALSTTTTQTTTEDTSYFSGSRKAGALEYSHWYGGKTIYVSINKDCEDIPADLVIPEEIDGYRVVSLYQFDSPAIKSITLPDSVEVICAYAFEGAENLTTIKGGKNLNSIYNHAFKGCSSLKTFTISDNVKQLDKGMFEDCTSLESVYLNDNITELPESVFEGCTNLKTVTKLENITKIQNNCFAGCKSFKEFVISDKVEILGEKVFSDIDGLTVEYSSYPNRIKNIFDNCNNLTIRGYSGSSVERFAEYLNKNSNCTNVTFEAIDKKDAESGNENTPLSGDINNDGSINLKDAVLLRRYIAGGWNVTLDEKIADVNGDGTVNLKDVVMLRRFIAGGWGVTLGE